MCVYSCAHVSLSCVYSCAHVSLSCVYSLHMCPCHVCTRVYMCPSCVYSCAHVSLPRGALTFMCTHFPSSPILNSGWWRHQPRGPQPNTQTSLMSPFFPSSPSRSLTMVSQCLNISQSHLLPVLPHPHPSQRAVPTPPTLHTVATRMTFPSRKFYLTRTPLKTLPGSLIKQDVKLLLLLLLLSRFSRVRLCATP